jgi:hypothetical protein
MGASEFAPLPPDPVIALDNPCLSVVHPDPVTLIDRAMTRRIWLSSHDIKKLRVCMEEPPEANRRTRHKAPSAIPALQYCQPWNCNSGDVNNRANGPCAQKKLHDSEPRCGLIVVEIGKGGADRPLPRVRLRELAAEAVTAV